MDDGVYMDFCIPVMSLIHGSDHILDQVFTCIQRTPGIHTPVYMMNILASDWCICDVYLQDKQL